jgi:hypothetical protein
MLLDMLKLRSCGVGSSNTVNIGKWQEPTEASGAKTVMGLINMKRMRLRIHLCALLLRISIDARLEDRGRNSGPSVSQAKLSAPL